MAGQIDAGVNDDPVPFSVVTAFHDAIEAAGAAHCTDIPAFESLLIWFQSPDFKTWYKGLPAGLFDSATNAQALVLRYRLTGRFR